ncbi:MAG: hypothetical protein GVY36_14010 [Verrucomicrobia bacterium]|jgi:hypothetical protein|nr:hypothetical protein [Verrucomicrobiota bacterium]
MRFDSAKAFPYPVLRPYSDDFTQSAIQSTCDFICTAEGVTLSVHVALSSDEIREAISRDQAQFVVLVSCRATYFRSVTSFSESTVELTINPADIGGEVSVDVYVVATTTFDFESPEINNEFNSARFTYRAGELLAQAEPGMFYFDRELFKPLTSVFDLVKNDSLVGADWRIALDGNHVEISLSAEMKEVIDSARNSKAHKAVLLNSLYYAAVLHVIEKVKSSSEEFKNRKWWEILTKQIHNNGLDIESLESYEIANILLRMPLSLLEKHVFEGA